LLISGELH